MIILGFFFILRMFRLMVSLCYRIRPVFKLWRVMPRTSPVSASTQSCPSSSLGQKMVRCSSSSLFEHKQLFLNFFQAHTYLTITSLLCRYCAYLALKHLPSGVYTELWHGESLVCEWTPGLKQRCSRLWRGQHNYKGDQSMNYYLLIHECVFFYST